MRYEMAVLAALVQEDSPNTHSIVTTTVSLKEKYRTC